MTCEQAELRMAELLAGELAPEERAGLDRHLLDCATCRADFELARAGARIEWADVSVPREVIESTLASFREPSPAVRLLRWATAAAAVFGVVALLLTSSRAQKPAEEPTAEGCTLRRPQVLATMQEAVVGALVCKDEDGRPVGELGLKSHDVAVEILDGIAKTTVEENFENHTDRRLEGTFHFPLPSDASISRLALEVNGKIEEGTCLERERAREVFESIVRKMQDPALLEWQPGGLFKCRVFPIEPRSTKRVIVAYTQALPCFQGKMTYVYPLASEKTRTHPPGEASIAVQARFSGGLAQIASPSHHLEVQRKDANEASMAFRAANYRPNNDFVVTMEPGEEEVRVVSHKIDGDDGYFACFATPKGGGARVPGKYAFVLDASASISAPRLEVARRLVRAMMERRIEGDRFEILAHNVEVERSGEVDLRAANDFMDRLRPIGGSDVLKALLAAGDAEAIYIGKGSATFGETEPSRILEAVKGRRIRTIAVGSDANGTLLERLGGMMRVNPNDDVAKRVEEIAATLGSPVLSDVKVEGGEAVYDVVGVRDLFYGERLVVSGRYRGPTAKLMITGNGYRREVDVAFPAKEEGNNYARRLWAQRKVSDLLAQGPAKKPEVTELGVKYQIMTPYTSFLVLETEQMWKDFQLKREVQKQDTVLSVEDKTRGLMEEAVGLYTKGKAAEASAKFEQAFELKPSSDQVYAFIQRAGVEVVGRMMNDPDRKAQDLGRRLMELAKPATHHFDGKVVVQKYVEDLKSDDHAIWRNSYWHLKRLGQEGMKEVLPALGDQVNDRFRSRTMLLLTEMGAEAAPAVTEALKSSDPFVRANAAIVLGNIRDGRSLPELKKLAENPNETADVRKFASEAVRKIPNPEPRSGKTTDLPDQEDPKARAIREAYEEQLLRDRQEVVLNFKKASGNDEIVEEFRRQSGWNFVVDGRSAAADYEKYMKEALVRTPSNQLGGLEFALGEEGPVGTLRPERWGNLPQRLREGLMKGKAFEAYSAEAIERWDESKGIPYADFTLDFDASLVSPTHGGGKPLTGATWSLGEGLEVAGKAARINDLQRQLDAASTLNGKYEADMQVFVRQLEVQLAQIQELNTKVDEHRAKLAKTPNQEALVGEVIRLNQELGKLQRQSAEQLQLLQEEPMELVAKRQPKGLSEMREEISDEDKLIVDKLRSIRITINMQNAPVTAIVDFMREVSGLNIHASGIDGPNCEAITFKVQDMVLAQALRQLLEPRNRTYRVRDGVVLIAPVEVLEIRSVSEDGATVLVSGKGMQAGKLLAITRDTKFVAVLRIDTVREAGALARMVRGLAVGRLIPGDRANVIEQLPAFLATLPAEVRMDLSSRANQQTMRAKMELSR